MPSELDPRWEFWTPDAEIAELMGDRPADGFHALPHRDGPNGGLVIDGFRVGTAVRSIDADRTRLAPPRPERAADAPKRSPRKKRATTSERKCDGCGCRYRPKCRVQKCCSLSCRGKGRRTLPDRVCVTCGEAFRSCNPNPQFCSIRCRVVKRNEAKDKTAC